MTRWPAKPLGELVNFIGGGTPRRDCPDYWGGEIPWASVKDLQSQSLGTTLESITAEGLANSASNLIPKGTVIIASRVGLGKVAINLTPVTINQDLKALTPRDNNLFPRYLLLFLLSKAEYFEQAGVGATVKGLTIADYQNLKIPVPPLAEQERIVKLLDEADELRKLRTQADRRTADLIPALFHEMFGQADFVENTIGQFLEQGWLLLHKDGNHGSLYPRSSDFGTEGVPFLSSTCVTDEGTIDHSKVKRLAEEKAKLLRHGWIECGDVLLAHNASVGAVGFYDGAYDRAIIGTSLTAFRANPDRIEPHFLWASLRDVFFQDQLERIMKQALRNQVPITTQKELFLRIPSLPLQKDFAARVAEIRAMEVQQAASRQRLDALFQSMLHSAFLGDL